MAARGISAPRRALVFAVIGLVYLGAHWFREGQVRIGDWVLWSRTPAAAEGSRTIDRLFDERRSDVVVEVSGRVDRVLADDDEGSRHQRFVLRLDSGHTVLVAHNLDLARRVPLQRGDRLEVKGEYEWTERGGVLHWTHRDPRRRHEGGWIRHDGEQYE